MVFRNRSGTTREGRASLKALSNNALQLTRARSAQQVRAERHFVPHRASIIYGPSQLNAVLSGRWGAPR
jgi:hypothetical protein